jgi:hypothetical protein
MEPNFTFRQQEATVTREKQQIKFKGPHFPMTDTNQKQLGNTLWSIADQLRGAMDADDFRDYMLSFLFLRYLFIFPLSDQTA